jgi:hypothetical protein
MIDFRKKTFAPFPFVPDAARSAPKTIENRIETESAGASNRALNGSRPGARHPGAHELGQAARVFDIEHCPNCGGSLKIIAAIEDTPVIVRILTHLGLSTRASPRSLARRFDLFQTAWEPKPVANANRRCQSV